MFLADEAAHPGQLVVEQVEEVDQPDLEPPAAWVEIQQVECASGEAPKK